MRSRLIMIHSNPCTYLMITLVFLLSFFSVASANNNVCEIKGNVKYWNNQPASGIEIILMLSNGTIANSTLTNTSGHYYFSNAVPGNYSLIAKYNNSIVHIYKFSMGPDVCLWHNISFRDSDGDGIPDDGGGENDDEDDDTGPGDDTDDNDEPITPPEKNEGKIKIIRSTKNLIIWMIIVIFVIIILSLAIFSRIRRSHILNHETRDRISNHIRENPGAHFTAIKKDLGLSTGVLSYHMERLERENFVISRAEGKYKRFYPPRWDEPPDIHLSQIQEIILEQIKKRPGISQSDLGSNIGRNRKVINYQAHQLRELGLIDIEKEGRESRCYFVRDA